MAKNMRLDQLESSGTLAKTTGMIIRNSTFQGYATAGVQVAPSGWREEDPAAVHTRTLLATFDWAPYEPPWFLVSDWNANEYRYVGDSRKSFIGKPGKDWKEDHADDFIHLLDLMDNSPPGMLFVSPRLIWLHDFEPMSRALAAVMQATLEPYAGWVIVLRDRTVILQKEASVVFDQAHAEILVTLVSHVKEFQQKWMDRCVPGMKPYR